jgi:CMP-N-acetylneuraminic acid synthetase
MYIKKGNHMHPFLGESSSPTCQEEFETVYVRNGAIYITRRNLLMEKGRIIGESPLGFLMPRYRSVNIDEKFDLELARALLDHKDRFEKIGE